MWSSAPPAPAEVLLARATAVFADVMTAFGGLLLSLQTTFQLHVVPRLEHIITLIKYWSAHVIAAVSELARDLKVAEMMNALSQAVSRSFAQAEQVVLRLLRDYYAPAAAHAAAKAAAVTVWVQQNVLPPLAAAQEQAQAHLLHLSAQTHAAVGKVDAVVRPYVTAVAAAVDPYVGMVRAHLLVAHEAAGKGYDRAVLGVANLCGKALTDAYAPSWAVFSTYLYYGVALGLALLLLRKVALVFANGGSKAGEAKKRLSNALADEDVGVNVHELRERETVQLQIEAAKPRSKSNRAKSPPTPHDNPASAKASAKAQIAPSAICKARTKPEKRLDPPPKNEVALRTTAGLYLVRENTAERESTAPGSAESYGLFYSEKEPSAVLAFAATGKNCAWGSSIPVRPNLCEALLEFCKEAITAAHCYSIKLSPEVEARIGWISSTQKLGSNTFQVFQVFPDETWFLNPQQVSCVGVVPGAEREFNETAPLDEFKTAVLSRKGTCSDVRVGRGFPMCCGPPAPSQAAKSKWQQLAIKTAE